MSYFFRTFVGIQVAGAADRLEELVSHTDQCLAEFNLPQYYKDPSFHASVCWAVGDVKTKITHKDKEHLQVGKNMIS